MKLAAKLFFNNKLLKYLLLALYIITIIFPILNTIFSGGYSAINFEQSLYVISVIYFIMYMFITYEYVRQIENSCMLECINSTKKNTVYILKNELKLLSAFVGIQSLFYILMEIFLNMFSGILTFRYFVYSVISILVNYFLVCAVGIMLGAFSALRLKRIPAYLLMIAFAILTSGVVDILWNGLYLNQHIDVSEITELFVITVPSNTWTANAAIGYTLLPFRIAMLMFWIALSFFGIVLSLHKISKKILKSCTCASLAVIFIAIYFLPSSKSLLGTYTVHCPGAEEHSYYNIYEENIVNEEAEFCITDLSMNISSVLQLKAAVTIKVDLKNLSEYKFTLYHTYKIKNVMINGNEAEYERNYDYIDIHNTDGVTVDEITIEYSGYSDKYYSNIQGILLPGLFPFYPLAGYIDIYNDDKECFTYDKPEKEINFDITVKSIDRCFSNLAETDNNHFVGSARTFTIVSGMFKEEVYDDVRIVYPYMDTAQMTKEFVEYLVNNFVSSDLNTEKIKTIIFVPSLNQYEGEKCYFDYDYAVTRPDDLEYQYTLSTIGYQKSDLYKLMTIYYESYEEYTDYYQYCNFFEIFDKCAKTINDDDAFLAACDEYLYNQDDTRTIEEFLNDLLEEQNA